MRNQENKLGLHETKGARFGRDFRNWVNWFLGKFEVVIAGIKDSFDKESNHHWDREHDQQSQKPLFLQQDLTKCFAMSSSSCYSDYSRSWSWIRKVCLQQNRHFRVWIRLFVVVANYIHLGLWALKLVKRKFVQGGVVVAVGSNFNFLFITAT